MIVSGFSNRDRFDRMRRVNWIDVDSIHKTRCLVVGAGALGNEAVKDLVLAGFRDITIVDMDDIVVSNLSRCLFFRESDVKKVMKANTVAERASELDPEVNIRPLSIRIQDLDEWDFDIILGCLDNISARMHTNSHAYYYGIPYVDGATDGLYGKVQVVLPNGPCLQCTMNRSHIREMEKRFTCTGSGSTYVPKIASDITTTSVIAGIQVREAMKIVSGRADMCIRHVSYYDGDKGEMFTVEATIDKECQNHIYERTK